MTDFRQLAAQLRKPEGPAGRQVGEMMNKGNILINGWAVEALALKDKDLLLEIGMGNGAFVEEILNGSPTITYHGIDYAATMVEEATLKNRLFIQQGRAVFLECDAKALPYAADYFTHVLCVNTIYFWEDPHVVLLEIARVLKSGGTAVFAIRTKDTMDNMPFTAFGFSKYNLYDLIKLLEQHFSITDAFRKSEPPYLFNNEKMVLENAIVVCKKK